MMNLNMKLQYKYLVFLTSSLCLVAVLYLLNQKLEEQIQIKKLADKLAVKQDKPVLNQLDLSNIELPPPPKIKRGRSQLNQNTNNNRHHTKLQRKQAEKLNSQNKINEDIKPVTDEQANKNYQDVLAGKGPSIEIAWPSLVSEREMLFQLLTQCTGMRLGILNNGNINLIANRHVRKTELSEFVRIINGKMTQGEKYQFYNNKTGTPVRLFPLSIDINLIKKLSETQAYYKSQSITGQYQVALGHIWLKDISYDGNKVKGPKLIWQNDC